MNFENLVHDLSALSPLFMEKIKSIYSEWENDPPKSLVLCGFSDCIIDNIQILEIPLLERVFVMVESALLSNDKILKDLIATVFLESFQNSSSSGEFDFKRIVDFLGEESIKYCKAWDEFTGVKTEGLY